MSMEERGEGLPWRSSIRVSLSIRREWRGGQVYNPVNPEAPCIFYDLMKKQLP